MDISKLFEDIIKKDIDRRQFFKWIGRISVLAAMFELVDQVSCGSVPQTAQPASTCMQPQTEDEKIIYAMCDTILPGMSSDPTGAPGAVDACTMDVVYDKFYGIIQVISPVLLIINAEAKNNEGRNFYELNLDQRTTVLKSVESMLGIIDQVYMFMKGPFYIGIISRLGLDYMGDPGPNLGYRDQDFSFYKPMSQEMTSDGNLP